ncbi:MAG: radical SAM/SPASM domain-containing protein [Verrucomicrobiota bacterium]
MSDLLEPPAERGESTFWLRPHVLDEIERISDPDLGRYLFHRYRYDVFPVTKEVDGFPPCVQIEPTSICNFRCVFCFQTDSLLTKPSEGHMGQIPLSRFKRIVDELEGNVEFVTLASRGEPLLTKGIESMLAYASGKFLGLKVNTNATFLSEKMTHAILQAEPNTLVFSADAADPVTYPQLRVNGNFGKVMGNIRRFMEIKEREYPDSRTITRVSGVAFDRERQDHVAIESFWSEFVDQVAFVDYNPWENTYDNAANGVDEACSDLWRRTFVWWDGRMNPCDVDYRSFLSPGNIDEFSVADLWAGPGYSLLRRQHLALERQGITPCRGCVTV